jgi:hypothetical protein
MIAFFSLVLTVITTPKDLVGNWEGLMEHSSVGKGKTMRVSMQLNIAETKIANQYTYQMVYERQPPRNYLLKAVDVAAGHWQVDEQNGIVLDAYWVDGTMMDVFSTGGYTILTSTKREGRNLVWSLTTYETKTLTESGGKGGEMVVSSNRILSVQKAVLRPFRRK